MRIRLAIGLLIVAAVLVFGFGVSLLAPDDPRVWQTFPRNQRPSLEHVFGTTALGQDTFFLLSWSLRNSLMLGVSVAALATIIGVAVGLIAGYRGGTVDRALSFLMDMLIVIPSLPLLILLSAMTKGQSSLLGVGAILVIFNWPFPARQIRAVALSMREREFVNLAWYSGDGLARILWKQMVPYLRRWAVANFINTILVVVAIESSLAFLGLSNDNVPTLGTMIYWALKHQALLAGRWWWLLPPIACIILTFVGFFFLANALADRSGIMRSAAR